jgi:hypothetical protein
MEEHEERFADFALAEASRAVTGAYLSELASKR